MSRFKTRSGEHSIRGHVWPIIIGAYFMLLVTYLVWIGWPRTHAVAAGLNTASTREDIPISAVYTGQTWNGKPVYELSNEGGALKHVNVYNWAEDQLPILYIGTLQLPSLPGNQALEVPPYDLPSHEHLWFVASSLPPSQFTVTWDASDGVLYTTIEVTDKSHARKPSTSHSPSSHSVAESQRVHISSIASRF